MSGSSGGTCPVLGSTSQSWPSSDVTEETKNGRNAIWARCDGITALGFCCLGTAGGQPLRERYQDIMRRHSARRRPDQSLHKIASDRPFTKLRGPRAHGGGDRKGVQDRHYEAVCRCCPWSRRSQGLHKISLGRSERFLQECDLPNRGGQENFGTRGSLAAFSSSVFKVRFSLPVPCGCFFLKRVAQRFWMPSTG